MKERYELLIQQLDALFEGESDQITILSNASALLFHNLDNLNWAGFYLYKNSELILGPFQGKVACMHIPLNKGVCGKAASTREIQCIENVHDFPGHIACDGASNSEIVVPIVIDNELFGVLDIDSFEFSNFNEIDVTYLGLFIEHLIKYL
ncbi:GAF domain-containing protein [Tannockella kyphosi]|uniref:GAF domain-containing protein n=1 Tax=Tannockella kyphosi TaxID=2899121 RepID=UPI00201370DA|nr:GAF domain-containing protein [Tannockella kyphosi]